MKSYFTYLVFLPFLGVMHGAPPDPQPSQPPRFSITISAPRDTIRVGSPATLSLTLENTSDKDIRATMSVLEGVALRVMDIKVWDNGGKLVPETDFGMRIHRRLVNRWGAKTSSVWYWLAPGKTVPEESDLAKEFDLSKPGRYTVQAQRLDTTNDVVVKSNTVTFTIVE